MAAHLRGIVKTCNRCEKTATVELRNTYNSVIGEYCAKHGQAALKDFADRYEKEEA